MKKEVDKKLIGRIQKLFALESSPSINEATAAINKAKALMAEYDLTYGEVNFITVREKRERKKRFEWETFLFVSVCNANNCVLASNVSRHNGRYLLAGREINVFLSLEMFKYLKETVNKEAKKICKGKGIKFNYDFKMSAVRILSLRLQEYGNSWAVDREAELKAVMEYVKLKENKKPIGSNYNFENREAILAGIKAGNNISLHKQTGIDETKLLGGINAENKY